jgi:hypothetical protein
MQRPYPAPRQPHWNLDAVLWMARRRRHCTRVPGVCLTNGASGGLHCRLSAAGILSAEVTAKALRAGFHRAPEAICPGTSSPNAKAPRPGPATAVDPPVAQHPRSWCSATALGKGTATPTLVIRPSVVGLQPGSATVAAWSQGGVVAAEAQTGTMETIACPVCVGPLTLRGTRATCPIGHKFKPDELQAGVEEEAARALWAAVRSLEDTASGARWRATLPDPAPRDHDRKSHPRRSPASRPHRTP